MKLSELYTNLSYGVLSGLSLGGEGSGAVPGEFQDRLLHHVSRGLTALHTRFLLSSKEVVVRTFEGKTMYPIRIEYAFSNSTKVAKKHVSDSEFAPFLGDLIKIISVTDELGDELPLNDTKNRRSLFTPSPDTLQIPRAIFGDAYFVQYQADHAPLVEGDLTQEVIIPGILQESLELYIASKVFSAMNGQEHVAKGVEYLQRFDAITAEIEKNDLLSTSQIETTSKFRERGFI